MYILFIQEGNRKQWQIKVSRDQLQQKPALQRPYTKSEINNAVLDL